MVEEAPGRPRRVEGLILVQHAVDPPRPHAPVVVVVVIKTV